MMYFQSSLWGLVAFCSSAPYFDVRIDSSLAHSFMNKQLFVGV